MGPIVLGGALQTALRSDNVRAAQGMRDLASLRGFLTGPAITPADGCALGAAVLLSLFTCIRCWVSSASAAAWLLFGLAILNEVHDQGAAAPGERGGVA